MSLSSVRAHPSFEGLEHRLVPASTYWTGALAVDWGDTQIVRSEVAEPQIVLHDVIADYDTATRVPHAFHDSTVLPSHLTPGELSGQEYFDEILVMSTPDPELRGRDTLFSDPDLPLRFFMPEDDTGYPASDLGPEEIGQVRVVVG